jgi:hypothetical protein
MMNSMLQMAFNQNQMYTEEQRLRMEEKRLQMEKERHEMEMDSIKVRGAMAIVSIVPR